MMMRLQIVDCVMMRVLESLFQNMPKFSKKCVYRSKYGRTVDGHLSLSHPWSQSVDVNVFEFIRGSFVIRKKPTRFIHSFESLPLILYVAEYDDSTTSEEKSAGLFLLPTYP